MSTLTPQEYVLKECSKAYCELVKRVYYIRFDDRKYVFLGSGKTESEAWKRAKEMVVKSNKSYKEYKIGERK